MIIGRCGESVDLMRVEEGWFVELGWGVVKW